MHRPSSPRSTRPGLTPPNSTRPHHHIPPPILFPPPPLPFLTISYLQTRHKFIHALPRRTSPSLTAADLNKHHRVRPHIARPYLQIRHNSSMPYHTRHHQNTPYNTPPHRTASYPTEPCLTRHCLATLYQARPRLT